MTTRLEDVRRLKQDPLDKVTFHMTLKQWLTEWGHHSSPSVRLSLAASLPNARPARWGQ